MNTIFSNKMYLIITGSVFLTLCTALVLLLTSHKHVSEWLASQSSLKNEISKKDIEKYFFEVNDGIPNAKAYNLLCKAKKVINDGKGKGCNNNERLEKALSLCTVTFINCDTFDFAMAIATWLKGNRAMIENIVNFDMGALKDKNTLQFFNVIREMACHINLQELGEKISVIEYNKAFYKDSLFNNNANNKMLPNRFLEHIFEDGTKAVAGYIEKIRKTKEGNIIFEGFDKYIKSKKYNDMLKK